MWRSPLTPNDTSAFIPLFPFFFVHLRTGKCSTGLKNFRSQWSCAEEKTTTKEEEILMQGILYSKEIKVVLWNDRFSFKSGFRHQ